MSDKLKLGMYWASSCGGCEISLININEKILELDEHFEFVFCPCLLDTKRKDLEAVPNEGIDITFFNGAIRTEENEEMAHLLRKKSKMLIAYGTCSHHGCIPALSNLSSPKDHLRSIYVDNPTTDNPSFLYPKPDADVPEGKLHIPEFFNRVRTLEHVEEIDYFIPGCPPESRQVWNFIEMIIRGDKLPPQKSVIGAGNSTVCHECERKKEDKKIKKLYRTYEIIPDLQRCLLEQGIICMGIATRDGCGALCPKVNTPCTGCYGPPEGIMDQGAKMIAALGSLCDINELKKLTEEEIVVHINEIMDSIPDLAGTFYKYSLADSILGTRGNYEADND
jgi:F420-non-reducing hydrogenase small subunit